MSRRTFVKGDRVKVAGSVGFDDAESGSRCELRGLEAEVVGANALYRSKATGKVHAHVVTEGGAYTSIPIDALRPRSASKLFGGLGDAWERIFGRRRRRAATA